MLRNSTQEADIEKIVKCRIRSEVEGRKAAESSMKRATKESFELKKELTMMRKEIMELRKQSVSTPVRTNTEQKETQLLRIKIKKMKETFKQKEEEHAAHIAELEEQVGQAHNELSTVREQLKEQSDLLTTTNLSTKKATFASDESKRRYLKQIEKLKAANAVLMKEKATLSDKYHGASKQLEQRGTNKREVLEAKEKLVQLKKASKSAKVKKETEYNEMVEQLEHARNTLRAENTVLNKRIDFLEEELMNVKESKKPTAPQAPETSDEELDTLHAKHATLCEKLEEMERTVDTKEQEITDVHEENKKISELLHQEQQEHRITEQALEKTQSQLLSTEATVKQSTLRLDRIEAALKQKGITMAFLLKTDDPVGTGSTKRKPTRKVVRSKNQMEAN